jgi:hypothetical protein
MHHQTLDTPRRFKLLSHVAIAALAASSLARCSCEEVDDFIPSARYAPDVLDFGQVSVAGQRTLQIEVRSVGSSGLTIVDALVDGASDKFAVVVPEDLLASLAPGQTSSIAVTYRPCPMAWDGNTLKEAFDYNDCPGAPDANDVTITDNTATGGARIPISGQPVQPPTINVRCPMGSGAMTCNENDPEMLDCNGISFGTVNGGEAPCDLVMEIENEWRLDGDGNAKQVGTLEIERFELLVRDLNTGRQYSAEEAGFAVIADDGGELALPFLVPITEGETKGKSRFKVQFAGTLSGLFRGEAAQMTGLRLYTNDPDHPIYSVPLTAIGSAPDLTILRDNIINFGPVEQGLTKTATRTLNNFGDATLTIDGMSIESGNSEFTFTTSKGTNYPITIAPNEVVVLTVSYSPVDTGTDLDKLLISSNDPDELAPDFIELRGGAVPTIEVEPADVLVFALPQPTPPPPLPPRTECLTISNTGFGNLIIDELKMAGSDDDLNHPSVDDFTIDGTPACNGTNPCDPGINLCPPTDAGCMNSSIQLCFTYDNNDISTVDQVNLTISSNDPAIPEYTVVLQASDVPCFFPTPVITVVTPRPCMSQVLELTASNSQPGGDASGATTITSFNWTFGFAQPPTPDFMPADAEDTLFIPAQGGLYIVNLDITNSCGAANQAPAQEQIIVADTGCN